MRLFELADGFGVTVPQMELQVHTRLGVAVLIAGPWLRESIAGLEGDQDRIAWPLDASDGQDQRKAVHEAVMASLKATPKEMLKPEVSEDAEPAPRVPPETMPEPGLYWWCRDEDETGMSGEGRVAQVAVFEDGSAVLRWLADRNTAGVRSTVTYDSIADLLWVHGHGEKRTGHLEPITS